MKKRTLINLLARYILLKRERKMKMVQKYYVNRNIMYKALLDAWHLLFITDKKDLYRLELDLIEAGIYENYTIV